MITPHVTGKIALMLEKDPDLTPAQIKEMMDKEMTDKDIADKDTIGKEK